MAIRDILKMGNPRLRELSRKIEDNEFGSENLKSLIQDMRETMIEANGIGIAAPQIGELVQVAIVCIENQDDSSDDEFQEVIVINPNIEYLTDELSGNWEGCLSVPGLRGYVERPSAVRVTFQDINGSEHVFESDSFSAIVFQHELDHLFGKLYVDRITDIRNLVYEDQLATE
jgi:peptide deformylase